MGLVFGCELDGNGFTVSNLKSTVTHRTASLFGSADQPGQGLIGYSESNAMEKAYIHDIFIKDINITAPENSAVGGIAIYANGLTIERVSVTGIIESVGKAALRASGGVSRGLGFTMDETVTDVNITMVGSQAETFTAGGDRG